MIRPLTSRYPQGNRLSASGRRFRCERLTCVCVLSLYLPLSATAIAQSAPPPSATVATSQPLRKGTVQSPPRPGITRWWQSIGLGILLLVILATSVCAILVFSRRFKEYLKSESREPTPSDDVWPMHKLTNREDSDHAADENDSNDSPSDAG